MANLGKRAAEEPNPQIGRMGAEDPPRGLSAEPQKLRTRSASIVSLTRSTGVMNDAFGPAVSCETPRASAQPFQT